MIDLSHIDAAPGMNIPDLLNLQEGLMPHVDHPEDDDLKEDETERMNEVEGPVGPTDHMGFPLKYAYRRAFSEMELLESLAAPDFQFQEGWCYCFMSRGDVDLLSYLKLVLQHQNVERLIVSAWKTDETDIKLIRKWMEYGRIAHLDIYLGRMYAYGKERRYDIRRFRGILEGLPECTVKVFRNHSKIIAGKGEKFNFVIQGSANMNTNVNAENVCIIIDDAAYDFYSSFFKDIKSLI